MIKIGLTGVHGSGKSTKAKELEDLTKRIGKSVLIVDKVARSCPHTLGTIEAQEWIWTEQMAREKYAMICDVDAIVCDRTVMDNLMYYYEICEALQAPLHNQIIKEWDRWDDLHREACLWMSTYTQVIRLPLNLGYLKADDPIRPKEVAYARRIDALFDRFVDEFVTQHGSD